MLALYTYRLSLLKVAISPKGKVRKVFNIFVLVAAAAATMKLRRYYIQKELMK
jgi:hypothetical protein